MIGCNEKHYKSHQKKRKQKQRKRKSSSCLTVMHLAVSSAKLSSPIVLLSPGLGTFLSRVRNLSKGGGGGEPSKFFNFTDNFLRNYWLPWWSFNGRDRFRSRMVVGLMPGRPTPFLISHHSLWRTWKGGGGKGGLNEATPEICWVGGDGCWIEALSNNTRYLYLELFSICSYLIGNNLDLGM